MRPTHPRRALALLLMTLAGSSIAAGCSGTDTLVPPEDIVVAEKAPPPINGGTLAIAPDGHTAIAADTDRDVVWIVDVDASALKAKVQLNDGDQPGRVAIDKDGNAHVVLMASGAVAKIDVASGKLVDRRDVCAAPRGIAYDAAQDALHVACAGGELVRMPAAGGAVDRKVQLDRDLRDVLVQGDKLIVSRLRSAEVLVVGPEGKVWQRQTPAKVRRMSFTTGVESDFEPAVAWRMVGRKNGGALMIHQRGMSGQVETTTPGGYSGGGCDEGIVQTTVTEIDEGGEAAPIIIPSVGRASLPGTALPVDIAISPANTEITVVAAGSNAILRKALVNVANSDEQEPCQGPETQPVPGQPIAAAYLPDGTSVVQLREPAALYLPGLDVTISLPGESRRDTGHDVFHMSPGVATGMPTSIACASCHPGGGDDARTWNFTSIGPRRTQTVRGGISDTAPLHWDGDMQDVGHIMSEVFVNRMGGMPQGPRRARLIQRWMDTVPKLQHAEPVDTAAVERGKELYNDAKVACASCHSGAKTTNNQFADVGTGKQFQVPTLMNIADRAPFMHDGCAPTLRDRFDSSNACGGGDKHGVTSHLTSAQIDDLVAYLETL
jgi:DNA-binding beta-propeller fold protein YncE/mono/diheme cytochrome c family protein